MRSAYFNRFPLAAALCAAALTLAATPATAQTTVFDNGNPNGVGIWDSDPSGFLLSAEDFTLTATTTFDTVRWYGAYGDIAPPATDTFTISFFDTTSGIPDALPRTGETFAVGDSVTRVNGVGVGRFPGYVHEATLSSPVTMGAGTFAISIVNDTTADTERVWFWLTSAQTGSHFDRTTPNDTFASRTNTLAFQLINTPTVVPESGTVALLLPAFFVIGGTFIARRRSGK